MTLNEKLDEITDLKDWQNVWVYMNVETSKANNDDKIFIPLIEGYAENVQNHVSDYILNHSKVCKVSKIDSDTFYDYLIYIDLYIDEAKEA